jgi:uncharacterized RDD family membrane protein YckC
VVLVVVIIAYAVLFGWRGVLLIGTGDPGWCSASVIPIVGIYLIWREFQFGRAAEVLARELEARNAGHRRPQSPAVCG